MSKRVCSTERKRRMPFARQKAAQAWCQSKTSGIEMDNRLAEEFAKILVVESYEPHLGCATTGELLKGVGALEALAEICAHIKGVDAQAGE